MDAWRLKMKPCKVCGPVEADSRYFDEEHDLDPDPYISQKIVPDPH
jgi:hypothetical protein